MAASNPESAPQTPAPQEAKRPTQGAPRPDSLTTPEEKEQPTLLQRLYQLVLYVPDFVREEIWRVRALEARSWKGRGFGLLRMAALTIDGIRSNRLPLQAAALGYYTLIALGPLVAIAIMISGFIIKENSKEKIVNALIDITYFIAPPAQEAANQASFQVIDGESEKDLFELYQHPGSDKKEPVGTAAGQVTVGGSVIAGDSVKQSFLQDPSAASATGTTAAGAASHSDAPPVITGNAFIQPSASATAPATGSAAASHTFQTGAPAGSHTPTILTQDDNFDQVAQTAIEQARQDKEEEAAKENIHPSSQLVGIIDEFVSNARSGTMGIVGSLTLIVISIGLLGTIEKTFNAIWGVRRGRALIQQVFIYWTLITLGAVLTAAAVTLGFANIAANTFDHLPLGGTFFKELMLRSSPILAFLLVSLLLASFYRFIPNTRVRWQPALIGGLVVALMLYANQALSFLYIGFVVRQGSLFGAVGILPVLLFGLFIFWLLILLGGQITYAIQNVNTLTHQRVWDNVSHRTQELLALTALVLVSRRYEACKRPFSAGELAQRIRVPANILNSTLNLLCNIGFLTTVTTPATQLGEEPQERYQPGRPLNKITLTQFKVAFEKWGNNDGAVFLQDIDPLLSFYNSNLLEVNPENAANKDLQSLFAEFDQEGSLFGEPTQPAPIS